MKLVWALRSKLYPYLSKLQSNTGLFYFSFGNTVGLALNSVIWFILAAILSPTNYGQANYYIKIGVIGSILGTFGFNTVNIANIAKKVEKEAGGMLYFVLILGIIISSIIGVLSQSFLTALLSFSLFVL